MNFTTNCKFFLTYWVASSFLIQYVKKTGFPLYVVFIFHNYFSFLLFPLHCTVYRKFKARVLCIELDFSTLNSFCFFTFSDVISVCLLFQQAPERNPNSVENNPSGNTGHTLSPFNPFRNSYCIVFISKKKGVLMITFRCVLIPLLRLCFHCGLIRI